MRFFFLVLLSTGIFVTAAVRLVEVRHREVVLGREIDEERRRQEQLQRGIDQLQTDRAALLERVQLRSEALKAGLTEPGPAQIIRMGREEK